MNRPPEPWSPGSVPEGIGPPHPAAGYPPAVVTVLPPPGLRSAAPPSAYAPWGKRVAASLIDSAPALVGAVVLSIGYVELIVRLTRSGGLPGLDDGLSLMLIGAAISLLSLGWSAYNRWFIEGRGGQSAGKRALKIMLVSLQTGGPIGATNAFIRDLVHIVDGVASIGYLWPLWDDRRQTFADKIMDTVVINASPASSEPVPPPVPLVS